MSTEATTKAAELRRRAASVREGAARAERASDARAEREYAARLEREADELEGKIKPAAPQPTAEELAKARKVAEENSKKRIADAVESFRR